MTAPSHVPPPCPRPLAVARQGLPLAAALAVSLVAVSGCAVSRTTDAAPTVPSSISTHEPLTAEASNAAVLVAPGTTGTEPQQFGTADLKLDVTTVAGGSIDVGPGPSKTRAFLFPEFVEQDRYPRAVITVTNSDHALDPLNPGDEPFTWGGVFLLAPTSVGRTEDDGDNLIQRGLSSESALYKAEVDDLRPACTVRGSEGELTVRTPERITPGVWYAMYCQKEDAELRVRAWPIEDENAMAFSDSEFGMMGAVRMDDASIPISIGGKVSPVGRLVRSNTDQFNGMVAEAFFRIGTIS